TNREAVAMVASKNQYQKALDKAQSLGGTRLIVNVHNGRYTVRGAGAPTTYSVTLGADGELHCSCPAGSHDVPCCHAAACWLRRKGEEAAGLIARTAAQRRDGGDAPMQQRSGVGVGFGSQRW